MRNVLELKPNIILGDNYEGEITLSSWTGFQSRQGFYGSKDTDEVSTGLVKDYIQGVQVDYVKILSREQADSIDFLYSNSDKIRDSILIGLMKELPVLKEIYEDLVPSIETISDFKNAIGLSTIHIMDSDKDEFAYAGYELGCDWDQEHGLGVMMHKDRVIEIGQAVVSFDPWVTYKDNGTIKQKEERWNNANKNAFLQSKKVAKIPWWKIW